MLFVRECKRLKPTFYDRIVLTLNPLPANTSFATKKIAFTSISSMHDIDTCTGALHYPGVCSLRFIAEDAGNCVAPGHCWHFAEGVELKRKCRIDTGRRLQLLRQHLTKVMRPICANNLNWNGILLHNAMSEFGEHVQGMTTPYTQYSSGAQANERNSVTRIESGPRLPAHADSTAATSRQRRCAATWTRLAARTARPSPWWPPWHIHASAILTSGDCSPFEGYNYEPWDISSWVEISWTTRPWTTARHGR